MTPIGAGPPKPKSRRTIGILFFAAVIALNSAATQYVASRFAYHPALGAPLYGHVYAPWEWVVWYSRFGVSTQAVFQPVMIGLSASLMLGVLGLLAVSGRNPERHEGIHGTAHWASFEEIEATGLLPKKGKGGEGVYVGGWRDGRGRLRYLRHNGPEHIAAIAPTRSGKGVGLVVPTLLSWPHSVVVNDQKAELWNLTAAWRKGEAGNVVMKFDPGAEEGSVSFNPLEEIRLGTLHEVGDVQNLVTILVDPEGKGLVDHWAKTSHAFLTGAILHVLYKKRAEGKVGSLPDVALALSDPDRKVMSLYLEMIQNKWGPNGAVHITIASAARDMVNRPDEERGSVLSTAMSFLSLYRDPLVARNVARSDFKVMDLMNHAKPVTLFLVVRAEDKDRMKPLMRLIINQLVRVLLRPEITFVKGRPQPPHKHRLLLMLDEFPVLREARSVSGGARLYRGLRHQGLSHQSGHEPALGRLWQGRERALELPCPHRLRPEPGRDGGVALAHVRDRDRCEGGRHDERAALRRRADASVEDLSSDQPAARHRRRDHAAQVCRKR